MPHALLTTNVRYVITRLHNSGVSNAEIARRLNRHRATIGRELTRNIDSWNGYHYLSSQRHAQQRRKQANKRYKLKDVCLQNKVRHWLILRGSPEQIAGRLKREYPNEHTKLISHEAIYQWIYRQYKQGHRWHESMRKPRTKRRSRIVGKRCKNRGSIPVVNELVLLLLYAAPRKLVLGLHCVFSAVKTYPMGISPEEWALNIARRSW